MLASSGSILQLRTGASGALPSLDKSSNQQSKLNAAPRAPTTRFNARCSAGAKKSVNVIEKRFLGTRLRASGSERFQFWRSDGPGRAPKLRVAVRSSFSAVPEKPLGLYDPSFDKDSCGVGFVAELSGESSRKTVRLSVFFYTRMYMCMCIYFLSGSLDLWAYCAFSNQFYVCYLCAICIPTCIYVRPYVYLLCVL